MLWINDQGGIQLTFFQLILNIDQSNKIIDTMTSISELFQIDCLFWNQQQYEKVQQFIKSNSFLSKLYHPAHINRLINIILYQNISHKTIQLVNTKKPVVIILLKGQIQIYRTVKIRKTIKQITTICNQSNSVISINQDCRVESKSQTNSQFLFIPHSMYLQYNEFLHQQRLEKARRIIQAIFPTANKRETQSLCQASMFQSYQINHHIYQIGDPPTNIYVILQGCIKIQSGNSKKQPKEAVILSYQAVFGHRDTLEKRNHSAICYTANVDLLVLPIKLFSNNKISLPNIASFTPPKYSLSKQKSRKILPSLSLKKTMSDGRRKLQSMLDSYEISNQQKFEHQSKIMNNSHDLLGSMIDPRKTNSFRSPKKQNKNQIKKFCGDPMQSKLKLFRKIRPNPVILDINHRLF